MLPPSRPSDTTTIDRMSALVRRNATREKKESCSSTASSTIAASRAKIFGVTIMTMPRASLPARRTRDARLVAPHSLARAPGQHLDQVEVGDVGVGPQVDLLARLLLDDRGARHLADRQPWREQRAEPLGAPAGGDDRLPPVHVLARVDEVEHEVLRVAQFRPDHALHADRDDLGRDGAGVVGDQGHLGRAALGGGDQADSASAGPRLSPTSLRSSAFSCNASWPATALRRAPISSSSSRLFSPRASKVLSNQPARSRAGFSARSATLCSGLKIVLTPRCSPPELCP